MTNIVFSLRLSDLLKSLNIFYETKYDSEKEEYEKNRGIKLAIVNFIVEAKKSKEDAYVKKGFELLFDNTGCKEDYEILDEILIPLFENNIITNEDVKQYLGDSPLSRWM